MPSHEEALASLYSQRVALVKQLADIENSIKELEFKLQKECTSSNSPLYDEMGFEDNDAEMYRKRITKCMKDANGLRDALKLVDACGQAQQLHPELDEAAKAKVHFRNMFVHEALTLVRRLCADPNGSELMRSIVSLLTTGTRPARLHKAKNDESFFLTKDSELMTLIAQLGTKIVPLACDTNGGRVLQKVVDSLTTLEEFDAFAGGISDHVAKIAMDINGSHVLTKLIASPRLNELHKEVSTSEQNEVLAAIDKCIHKEIMDRCVEICRNRQGCCIVQKCMRWAPEPYSSSIIKTVLSNSLELVQDSFGNYVIQFILDRHSDLGLANPESKSSDYTNQIIRQILHHVAELSCNKFSSNVIEKCLKTASPDVRQLLVDELTEPQVLPKLLTDGFANYVIQTAIATASGESEFTQLRDSIMPLQDLLKHSPYGVKIEMKLSRRRRGSSRRQAKKEAGGASANSAVYSLGARPEPELPPPFLSPAMMAESAAAVAQPVALANLPPDVSLFQQQHMMGSMQFVLHGSQQFIGIPGAPPPFMNLLNGNGTGHEYQ